MNNDLIAQEVTALEYTLPITHRHPVPVPDHLRRLFTAILEKERNEEGKRLFYIKNLIGDILKNPLDYPFAFKVSILFSGFGWARLDVRTVIYREFCLRNFFWRGEDTILALLALVARDLA